MVSAAGSSPIPAPRLQRLRNLTPFVAQRCDKMGVGRRFFDTVVLKGTFELGPGVLRRAPVQAPITLADEYWDREAPERSSVMRAGDVVLGKPSTDILVTGAVRSPTGRPLRGWDVAVVVRNRARTLLRYTARVTGPREFRYSSATGWAATDPEPASEVPIRYELAYGGAYPARRPSDAGSAEPTWIVHRPNPSGTGFFDEGAMSTGASYRAPQWHQPGPPVGAINSGSPLVGLGPIARSWPARLLHAGTYDDVWMRTTVADAKRGLPPDYAPDFDPRFFQCAHPALVTPEHLLGDEHIGLGGMVIAQEQLVIRLPGLCARAWLRDGRDQVDDQRMPLDTVHIDLDENAVHLCWRLTLSQDRDVREAEIYTTEEP